jgi:hypothetical protein
MLRLRSVSALPVEGNYPTCLECGHSSRPLVPGGCIRCVVRGPNGLYVRHRAYIAALKGACSECGETGKDMMPEGNEHGKPCCVECWVGDNNGGAIGPVEIRLKYEGVARDIPMEDA